LESGKAWKFVPIYGILVLLLKTYPNLLTKMEVVHAR
jgi:hypothetical protein